MKNSERKLTGFEIAIIGIGSSFPQSKDTRSFWKNLTEGKELISFYSKEELAERGIAKEVYQQKNYVPAKGELKAKDYFDAAFFKYLPEEAKFMDPQTRLFHQVVWQALEDGAISWDKAANKIGLYAGASTNLLWKNYTSLSQAEFVDGYTLGLLSEKDFMPTLIAHKLGLKGPAISVNTACSTSLVAVHMATRALLMGECNLAVAGGVSLSSSTALGYFYSEGMIYAPDGHCRSFDIKGEGTITGEGAGAVVLKRLKDAMQDGDHIYAVIKGSALNNDGARKVGFTAPSVQGQIDCIKMAQKISKVTPDTISYVEAHGTATKLGDPIEVEALNRAFNNELNKSCWLGSVKSNLGHLDAAAGIAGLIKVALSLEQKQLPPSINFIKENPQIPFDQGPFQVVDRLRDWETKGDDPRRAGLSSFGVGGTNAHIILEEAPSVVPRITKSHYQIFPISAMHPEAGQAYWKVLEAFVMEEEQLNLSEAAFTLQTGRKRLAYKDFIVAKDRSDLLARLQAKNEKTTNKDFVKQESARVVFMFTGQGSQYFRMAFDLYEQEAAFKLELDKGLTALQKATGEDYAAILFHHTTDETKINQTEYTQPLLFVLEYALAQYLLQLGLQPDAMIGHSLGEYVAACLAGVFSFEDGIQIILKRASLISSLPKGAMLGIAAEPKKVETYLNENLSMAAINAPTQCVVSGKTADIEALATTLKAADILCKRLQTSHAFHSAMMDDILKAFESFLHGMNFHPPTIPYSSNLTGTLIKKEEATDAKYWTRHLRETILFSQGIQNLFTDTDTVFIEVGPGSVLTKLAKQNKTSTAKFKTLSLLRSPKMEIDDQQYFLEKLATLWQYGLQPNWEAYYSEAKPRKISLPTYCFRQQFVKATVNLAEDLNFAAGTELGAAMATAKSKSLPTPQSSTTVSAEETTPSTLATEMLGVWKNFFGNDEIDLDADFFELGGDSLKAMSMINTLHKKFNVEIPVMYFMEKPTIMDIIEKIENTHWVNAAQTAKNKITI